MFRVPGTRLGWILWPWLQAGGGLAAALPLGRAGRPSAAEGPACGGSPAASLPMEFSFVIRGSRQEEPLGDSVGMETKP